MTPPVCSAHKFLYPNNFSKEKIEHRYLSTSILTHGSCQINRSKTTFTTYILHPSYFKTVFLLDSPPCITLISRFSHVLEHLGMVLNVMLPQMNLSAVLKQWYRILKKLGYYY